jgi:hypothetical protein
MKDGKTKARAIDEGERHGDRSKKGGDKIRTSKTRTGEENTTRSS